MYTTLTTLRGQLGALVAVDRHTYSMPEVRELPSPVRSADALGAPGW